MPLAERPLLRPCLLFAQDEDDEEIAVVVDRLRQVPGLLRLSPLQYICLRLCNGQRTLSDIQGEALAYCDEPIPLDAIEDFLERMDALTLLDGPTYRALVAGPERAPACIGSYEEEPQALRRQLRRLFTGPNGPGLPRDLRPDNRLRAALVPHIDYARGGTTYAWGFKEIVERTAASLFLIVGTSHWSPHRFTLTRQAFRTPLGVAPTDATFLECLERHYGTGLYDDEVRAHLPEWSIELEVVFLQYLYESRRPIRIVPLVVGSFGDCIEAGDEPRQRDDIGRMVEAIRRTVAETPEPVCTLISGDLAHIGPYFEEGEELSDALLAHSQAQDRELLRRTEKASAADYFRLLADERDARRICGLPPTYTVLAALAPSAGRVLHYDQYVSPERDQSVSFASVAFYE